MERRETTSRFQIQRVLFPWDFLDRPRHETFVGIGPELLEIQLHLHEKGRRIRRKSVRDDRFLFLLLRSDHRLGR